MNLLKATDWPDEVKTARTPTASVAPRLQGVPKIHKQSCPLHRTVNMWRTPTYDLAKYLASVLKPLLGPTDTFVKNSTALAKDLDTVTVNPGVICQSSQMWSRYSPKFPQNQP